MEDHLSGNIMKYLLYGFCLISFIIGIILLVMAFSILDNYEYGLDYSWISKSVQPKLYNNGFHFLGVGHSFIKFPKTLQTIEFSRERYSNRESIRSRTADGLEVTLEISFQYLLHESKIYELYNKYGLKYIKFFQNVAIHILTEETTKYNAYEFFWDRGRIKEDFHKFLNEKFNEICFASIQFFQLRSIGLPPIFEDAIQLSEVKKQDIKKAEAELNKVKVEVDTRKKVAIFQNKVTINIAQGEANAIYQQNKATVDSFKKIQNTQSNAFKNLKSKLNFSLHDLFMYMKNKILQDHKGNDLFVNLKNDFLKQ